MKNKSQIQIATTLKSIGSKLTDAPTAVKMRFAERFAYFTHCQQAFRALILGKRQEFADDFVIN